MGARVGSDKKTGGVWGGTAVSIDLLTFTNALKSDDIQEIDDALRLYEGNLLQGFYLIIPSKRLGQKGLMPHNGGWP